MAGTAAGVLLSRLRRRRLCRRAELAALGRFQAEELVGGELGDSAVSQNLTMWVAPRNDGGRALFSAAPPPKRASARTRNFGCMMWPLTRRGKRNVNLIARSIIYLFSKRVIYLQAYSVINL